MPSVLTASDFDIKSVTFGKHKPNVNGGYNIDLSVGDSTDETVIQTPKMRAPFGIGTDKTNPFKKSIDISFSGEDIVYKDKSGNQTKNPIKALRDVIAEMDNLAIDYALKNCKTFFKKELTREVLSEYYSSSIKVSKKEDYADTFRFKLQYLKPNPEKNLDGRYLTTFWDNKGAEKNFAHFDKGDSINALIKPTQLWVANKQFGIQWICTQVRVHKQQKSNAYAFKRTDDDEEAVIKEDSEEEIEVEVTDEEVETDN
jgi:hypothetical protein